MPQRRRRPIRADGVVGTWVLDGAAVVGAVTGGAVVVVVVGTEQSTTGAASEAVTGPNTSGTPASAGVACAVEKVFGASFEPG